MDIHKVKTLKIHRGREYTIGRFFLFYWGYEVIRSIISYICNFFEAADLTNTVCVIFILIVIFLLWRSISATVKLIHVSSYLMLVIIYALQYLIHSEMANWLNANFQNTVFQVFPFIFLGACFCKMKVSIKELVVISRIVIVFMVTKYLFYHGVIKLDEEMIRAYTILPHLMIVTYIMIREKKWTDILCTVLGIFFLVICATRGPILLYVLFISYTMFSLGKLSRVVLVIGGTSTFILLMTSFGTNIIRIIADALETRGFSVRIFEMFFSGHLTSDNGRDILQSEVMKYVRRHPVLGNGLFSDRRATSVFSWTKYSTGINGWYSHNFVIELWCDFGYVMGNILLICLIILVVHTYKKLMGDKRIIYLAILFSSVLKLFMSGSYLEQKQFWLIIGIGITLCWQVQTQKKI